MPKKRTGKNPLSYLGVEAPQPPNITFEERPPRVNDYIGYNLGDIWVYQRDRNTSPPVAPLGEDIWMLVSKDRRIANATWINMAGQSIRSAFSAYLANNQNNIPADGTAYPIPFDSVYTNIGDDFHNTATTPDVNQGEYVAPIDGVYNFSTGVTVDNITGDMNSGYLQFFVRDAGGTIIRIWTIIRGNPANMRDASIASNRWRVNGTTTIPLNAGERVGVSVVIRNGMGNTVRIFSNDGTNRNRTWFSGFRVF